LKLLIREDESGKYVVNLFHIYLQMGHLSLANDLIPSLPAEIQAESTALLAITQEDYTAAITQYTALLESSPHAMQYTNNLALTYLYTANAQCAISAFEPALKEMGNKGILPHAVYNLCTMYEIRDDKARTRKEGIMETVVGLYGDVCGKGHFKLDSLR
jgi:tetratricopeptide (TPR) repeat protein